MTTHEFVCPECRNVTRHPKDIAEGYCPWCHWWTRDPFWRAINPSPRRKRYE